MKKIISLLLCLCMLLGSVCTTAFADDAYEFFETRQAINGYSAEAPAEFVIPSEIGGKTVESILESAFTGNAAAVVKLTLPESLMYIGNRNFNKSAALAEVILPETLQVIGYEVFRESAALEEITIPAAVTMIGKSSFAKNENLKSVTFTGMAPLYVGWGAFGNNHAEMVIYVPDDQIDAYTAVLPEGLNIQPSGANAIAVDYTASEDLFTFDAATGTITATTNRAPRLDIPATIGGVPVTAIGAGVFKERLYECCIVVPEGVTAIGDEAFASCVFLDYVDLPDSVTAIGAKAFNGFQGLVFEFPAQLQTIGEKAFAYSNIKTVVLPEGVTEIPVSAFERAKFSSLTLPETLTAIGEKAFYQCKYYEEVTIPASVTGIGSMAFAESDRLEKVIVACDPAILPEDALTDTDATVMTAGESQEPSSEPVAELGNAEVFVGTWKEGENYVLTLYADGTGEYSSFGGEAVQKQWVPTETGIQFTDTPWNGLAAYIQEDGCLNINDGWYIMEKDGAEATDPVEAPVETPTEEPVKGPDFTDSPYVGTWECEVFEKGTLVLNADGTGLYTPADPSYSPDEKTWVVNEDGTISFTDSWWGDQTVVLRDDGAMVIGNDWFIFTRADGAAPAAAAPAADAGDMAGKWVVAYGDVEGMIMTGDELASFGLIIEINLNADGTASMDMAGEVEEGIAWTADASAVTLTVEGDAVAMPINADGTIVWDLGDGMLMYFAKEGAEVTVPAGAATEDPTEEPTEDPTEEPVDAPAADASAFVGTWADADNRQLIINADGTGKYIYPDGSSDDKTWIANETGIEFTDLWWNGTSAVIEADGSLNIGSGWFIMQPGDGAVTEPAADVDTSVFMGVWYDAEANVLTVSENGEVTYEDSWGTSTMGWEVSGGKMMITTGAWWDSVLTITDGVLNVKDGYYIDYNFTREMPDVAAPAAPAGVAGTAEDFVGVWNASTMEMEGESIDVAAMGMVMELTINADGTASMYDGESTENANWTISDGALMIADMTLTLTLTEDGRLCMAEDGAAMYFVRGEAAPAEPENTDGGAPAVYAEMEDFVGRWFGYEMTVDGETIALADIDMTMEIELDAFGNISLYDGLTVETGFWTYVDGTADIDGMVLSLNADGTMTGVDPEGAQIVFTGFVGEWKAVYMATGGLTGDLRSMGITSTLILNADGTGSIDFPTAEDGAWYREDGYVRFGESGMPIQMLTGNFLKFGSDLAGYIVFSKDENAVWDPSMAEPVVSAPEAPVEPAAPETPAAPADGGSADMSALMERKFIAKTYTAAGVTMDASMLGEYSLLFHENGTCDFGMGGMVVQNLPWGLQKVSVGLNEVDAFVINYYGTMFNAVITEEGFDLDFYGSMILHYVPAE